MRLGWLNLIYGYRRQWIRGITCKSEDTCFQHSLWTICITDTVQFECFFICNLSKIVCVCVFYLFLLCELCMHGCIHWYHCKVSPPHCRDCHSWGQKGRTQVLCRYTGWPLNCPLPEFHTSLPPARLSTWSPECRCSPGRRTHFGDNRALRDKQVNTHNHKEK